MSLTKASYSMIDGAPFNILDYGADDTGVADSQPAIQAAIDAAAVSGGVVIAPAGTYKTSSSINLYGKVSFIGQGQAVTVIKPDASVLEAFQIGNVTSSSDAHTGAVESFTINRVTYDGATSNGGFVFYWLYQSSFKNIESREYKYNYWFKPQDGQAVAYTSFFNVAGVGGYYNIYWDIGGTGYANEITFYGGRMFTRAVTDTNIHWNGGSGARFVNMSIEGSGTQAVYLGGIGNFIEMCRTEGTWSTDDVVLSATSQRCFVLQFDYYTTITDNGTANGYMTMQDGSYLSSVSGGVAQPVLTLYQEGAGAATVFELISNRFSSGDFFYKATETATSNLQASLTTQGRQYVRQQYSTGNSSWTVPPIIIGNYNLWVDATGDLRIKNGAPVSDTDGTVVGTQT